MTTSIARRAGEGVAADGYADVPSTVIVADPRVIRKPPTIMARSEQLASNPPRPAN
jgi:hypothetical protein